jgi:hypothetical protein
MRPYKAMCQSKIIADLIDPQKLLATLLVANNFINIE